MRNKNLDPVPRRKMIDFVYLHPQGVALNWVASRPVLTTPQGGKVAVDRKLVSLWQRAHNRSLSEILRDETFAGEPQQPLRAALACLAEAGLLERLPPPAPSTPSQTSHHDSQALAGVSVVIVTCNSRQWVERCIRSLFAQTTKPLEIIVVDNKSDDGIADFLQSSFPDVKFIALQTRIALSAAINRGIHEAKGDFFLLLNPDVELEHNVIAEMLQVGQSAADIAAVAPKIRLLWTPSFLNGIGNRVGAFSWGVDNGLGHLDLGQFDDWAEIPSACFAAVLIPRRSWREVGALDEGYPLYYEDSDWSYRARLAGLRILAAPKAMVYHAFGSRPSDSVEEQMSAVKYAQVVYGRFRFAQKITNEKRLRFFGGYLLEDILSLIRFLLRGDFSHLRAYGRAVRQWFADHQDISQRRHQLQNTRKVDDGSLFNFQRRMPAPLIWKGMPELTWDIILRNYLPLMMSKKTKPIPEFHPEPQAPSLLIISHDVVDEKMAGPGMRYWEMAQALKQHLQITLAVPNITTLQDEKIKIVTYQETSSSSLQPLVESHEIALISGYMVEKFPFLKTTTTRLIVDLYTPMVLENIHYYLQEPMDVQMAANRHGIDVMNRLIAVGDFFICGNERQRDFWLGVLAAQGRVNPLNYAEDSRLYKLIDVVGMGFPSQSPRREKAILRGVHPNFPPEARIVLWGGGLWNWLDPLTLLKAWRQVLDQFPTARLVFLGTRHPNSSVPAHEMATRTIQLAEQMGEKDKTIIFLEWIPYKDREALLLEADVGVTLHPVHAETRFSLRTRVLDYIWAELPTVITEGDVTSEWVREYGIGEVAAEANPDDVARALINVLKRTKESYRSSFEPLKRKYTWTNVVKPVLEYCLTGDYAPDRRQRTLAAASSQGSNTALFKARLASLMNVWRSQGARGVLHRIWRYLQWKLSQP